MIIIIIGLSFLSALLYRMGGMGDDGRKRFPKLPAWFFDTKSRDLGCGFCTVGAMLIHDHSQPAGQLAVASLVTIPMMLGALSTYWDFLFGFDNFWVHGFFCGVALVSFAVISGHWWVFVIRCLALAIAMGAWSLLIGDDDWEESGRGFVLPLSTLIG